MQSLEWQIFQSIYKKEGGGFWNKETKNEGLSRDHRSSVSYLFSLDVFLYSEFLFSSLVHDGQSNTS